MDGNTVVLLAALGLLGVGGYFAIKTLQAGTVKSAREQREQDLLDKKIVGGLTFGTGLALADELGLDDWLGF